MTPPPKKKKENKPADNTNNSGPIFQNGVEEKEKDGFTEQTDVGQLV